MKTKIHRALEAKKKLCIVLLLLPTMLIAQHKVAVCVIASDVNSDGTEILVSEFVNGLNQDNAFAASDATAYLTSRTPNKQDNMQLCQSGLGMGVDYICVINIEQYSNTNFVAVRLLDTKTCEMKARVGETSPLATIEEILNLTASLANQVRSSLLLK